MIRAIIFDYGNVISRVNNARFIEEISADSGKTGAELDAFINERADLLKSYETGIISSDEFFERFVLPSGLSIGKDEFIRLFTGRFSPVSETHELMRRMKTGYKLGLLSNTNPWDFEYEIKRCGVFHLFDTVTVSFEAGAIKPDEKIYLDALQKLDCRGDECVYIDDIKEYVDAACGIGIHGIHYISYEGLVGALRDLKCLDD